MAGLDPGALAGMSYGVDGYLTASSAPGMSSGAGGDLTAFSGVDGYLTV